MRSTAIAHAQPEGIHGTVKLKSQSGKWEVTEARILE